MLGTDGIVRRGGSSMWNWKEYRSVASACMELRFHELRRGNRAMIYSLTRKHRFRMRLPSQGHFGGEGPNVHIDGF